MYTYDDEGNQRVETGRWHASVQFMRFWAYMEQLREDYLLRGLAFVWCGVLLGRDA
jgi:hypothetical protein